MSRIQGYYTRPDKTAGVKRTTIGNLTWAAGANNPFELSRLPAGEYVTRLYFILEGRLSQDGNGSDGIIAALLYRLIEQVKISDQFGTLLDLTFYKLAQLYKIDTGQNPIQPPDIAASQGAATVYTNFKVIVPFDFIKYRASQPWDFVFPSTCLQDANLTIKCAQDVLAAAHASNAFVSGTMTVIAETVVLDKAIIPPIPEIGFQYHTDMTINLARGNYLYLWMDGFRKADWLLWGNVKISMDGGITLHDLRADMLAEILSKTLCYTDDDFQHVFSPLDTDAYVVLNDANEQPQPHDASGLDDTLNLMWEPILTPLTEFKISQLPRVENRLLVELSGTAHEKNVCYHRYRNHSASELEARAAMMGFNPGTLMAPMGNKRGLTEEDTHLQNLLPVVLPKLK